ncbi:hypothetical protein [Actinoplanes regularis]|uniref:hypothetical protein n=1 Tax=Actinoplanes regularis TaxID=52697 RepID=UPI0011787285|nr:hypothetical protein [Actinoplanes regularis]GIE91557.1 hypothetical protein Are01nite_80370 [Actinoplanes regularis]
MSQSYLVVLGDRRAIGWVLREQRMAFPATPRAEVRTLASGDGLYLYATRGAWGRPTRDRGRVIAYATAKSGVQVLDEPVEIAGRSFYSACDLQIAKVAPYPNGLELQPLVERISAFPKPEAWSAYLRRPLVTLSTEDSVLLDEHIRPLLKSYREAIATYP